MRGIGRRQCCWGLVAFGALTTVGCGFGSRGRVDATTGPRERERALCREAAGEVERSTGFVKDPRVAGYVRDVGARLIGASVAPGGDWTFGVVDDDEPNAFSLPGGHVYVSRGLLVFLNAEDELAGVLGHEVGHVVAHHAVRRATAATPVAVLFGVPAALLGVVSPDLGGLVAGTGKLAGGVVLSAYSREQEREADRLGMELAARAGWDPAGLSAALQTLARIDALLGHDPKRRSIFSTHPAMRERIIDTGRAAGAIARGRGAPIARTRPAFLASVDGLVVGPNPANGMFIDRRFVHPDLAFVWDAPAGWKLGNSPEVAVAAEPDGRAVLLLQIVGEGGDPVAGARAEGLRQEVVGQLDRGQIGGLPAARVNADSGRARLHLTWIAHEGRVYRITGASRVGEFERFRQPFVQSAGSFRAIDDAERRSVTVVRLRSAAARDGETLSALIQRAAGVWSAEQTAIANGIEVTTPLEPGWPVKVPVRETYRTGRGADTPRAPEHSAS